jgi:hypothetical protein
MGITPNHIDKKLTKGDQKMTKDISPEKLKAKAQELLNKAKEIEEKQFVKIGRIVYDYHQKGYEGFDLDKFKGEVNKAMEVKKRGKKKK